MYTWASKKYPFVLSASTHTLKPLFTGFNVKYFQDILGATSGDSLRLELGDALDPCLVRVPDRDDCLFVVMPMRLD